MKKVAVVLSAFAVMVSGCSDSGSGDGGAAGSGGSGGSGGSPPPPQAVDQTCRDWCANELEGPSCHQGPFESVQPCYEECLRDYQREAELQCGDEWIAIKDCQLDLDCEDLFGDCDSLDDVLDECHQRANNRDYCEANCPEFDIRQCEQDTAECRTFAQSNSRCESNCPTQDRSECIEQYISTGTCEYSEPTRRCRLYCSRQDLSQCVDQWLSTGRCEFDDGIAACSAICPPIGGANRECIDYWDATGMCPDPGTGGTGGGGGDFEGCGDVAGQCLPTMPCSATTCSFDPTEVDCATACARVTAVCDGACGEAFCDSVITEELCLTTCELEKTFSCGNATFGCYTFNDTCDSIAMCLGCSS